MATDNGNDKNFSREVISRNPFPGSRKCYVPGKLFNIQVPFREITLQSTKTTEGQEQNPPFYVYDTSGPYTDPDVSIDIQQGLKPLCLDWIRERGEIEEVDPSYKTKPTTQIQAFPAHSRRKPLRARKGSNVSQMHYAKKGVITPEMEFIAIRENQLAEDRMEEGRIHKGEKLGPPSRFRLPPNL